VGCGGGLEAAGNAELAHDIRYVHAGGFLTDVEGPGDLPGAWNRKAAPPARHTPAGTQATAQERATAQGTARAGSVRQVMLERLERPAVGRHSSGRVQPCRGGRGIHRGTSAGIRRGRRPSGDAQPISTVELTAESRLGADWNLLAGPGAASCR